MLKVPLCPECGKEMAFMDFSAFERKMSGRVGTFLELMDEAKKQKEEEEEEKSYYCITCDITCNEDGEIIDDDGDE